MYYPDLAPYSYLNQSECPNVLAVGWLDAAHDFTRGHVDDEVLEQILRLCFQPVNPTRGFHPSPFFKTAMSGYPVEHKGKKMLLGSAEIRAFGEDGKTYAAPNLIYHYVRDCEYLPPSAFLEAVKRSASE